MGTKWLTAKQGAKYSKQNYRDFLKAMQSGAVRHVKRGKRLITNKDWCDEALFSQEVGPPKVGLLSRI